MILPGVQFGTFYQKSGHKYHCNVPVGDEHLKVRVLAIITLRIMKGEGEG